MRPHALGGHLPGGPSRSRENLWVLLTWAVLAPSLASPLAVILVTSSLAPPLGGCLSHWDPGGVELKGKQAGLNNP